MNTKKTPKCFVELQRLSRYINRRERLKFCILIVLSQLPALAELFVASLIALLAVAFSAPEKIYDSNIGLFLINSFGFSFLQNQRILAISLISSLCIVIAFKNAISLYQAYYGSQLSEAIARKFILKTIKFYLYAPWYWIIRNSSADLQFSINTAFQVGQMMQALSSFIVGCSTTIMLATGVLIISPVLAGIFLLVGGGMAFFVHQSSKKYLDTLNSKILQQQKELGRSVYFALHGLRETKFNNLESRIYSHMREQSVLLSSLVATKTAFSRIPFLLMEFLAFLALTLLLVFLLYIQQMSMEKTIAIMSFLVGVAWRILPAINKTTEASLSIRAFYPHVRILLQTYEQEERLNLSYTVPEEALSLAFSKGIFIKGLEYTYPGAEAPAVADINFAIPKGTMVGIVGLSGAGKSTLVSLLTGLLRPDKGMILLDDRPLTETMHPVWMRSVGYVPQAPFFFNDSLAANIALSDWGKEIDRERVQECCKLAVLDFIDQLEDGIDTSIGERGGCLSGGQVQRVAIARALYSRPELLIFDEATSALDQRNEVAIHNTVLSLRNEMTLLIIAHRLTTVADCDSIIWMDNGRIRAIGKPSEVLPQYTNYMNLHGTRMESEVIDA